MADTGLEKKIEPRNFLRRNWGKLAIAGITLVTAASIFFSIHPAKQELILDGDKNGRISISELVKGGGYHRGEAFGQYIKGLFGFRIDTDGDKLIDFDEIYTYKTLANKADQDGDGLSDGQEIKFGSSPYLPDSDFDKLSDYDEYRAKTNPLVKDTDSDGITDYVEVKLFHSNPLKGDSDDDGLADAEEARLGTPITSKDFDGDKLTDPEEVRAGSNPRVKDTDGDGLDDYEEVKTYKTSPVRRDTDGDRLDDKVEIAYGSSPIKPDTDADGLNDYYEKMLGTRYNKADSDNDKKSDYVEATSHKLAWQVGSSKTHILEVSNASGVINSIEVVYTYRKDMVVRFDGYPLVNYFKASTDSRTTFQTNFPISPGRHTLSIDGISGDPLLTIFFNMSTSPSKVSSITNGWRLELPSG